MGAQPSKSDTVMRVFAVSDLHTDAWEDNRKLVESFTDYGPNDVLIVAGDVAEDLDTLRGTYSTTLYDCSDCFASYVPKMRFASRNPHSAFEGVWSCVLHNRYDFQRI